MKKYYAASLLFLLTAWSGLWILACLHDASDNIRPEESYYWIAYISGLCAVTSLVLMVMVLRNSTSLSHWLTLWIMLTSVSITAAITLFLSPVGSDSLPTLFLALPQAMVAPVLVLLVSKEGLRSFGVAWPVFMVTALIAAAIFHLTISPAEQVTIYGPKGRPELELHIATNFVYYFRPFSVVLAMIAWCGTLLRPVLFTNATPTHSTQ